MGTDSERSRKAENKKLLRYGFRFYESVVPFQPNHIFANHRIYMGSKETVNLGINQSTSMTVPRGQADQLSASFELTSVLEAPMEKGTEVGLLSLTLDGETIATYPLVTLEEIQEGTFFSKAMDWINLQLGLE
jgi:D-alanyl-D-alanine carboxypeptidase (penicillin-binding protein 5/6)